MKVIYPGSFNPMHDGHKNVLFKAKLVFGHDKVDVVKADDIEGTLPEHIRKYGYGAVIRGLRNGRDLEYEKDLLYWYEDLGLNVPIVYFICDRRFCHISSTAIRKINEIEKGG